ncbi:hypothetical protein [Amphritea sp. HPY]|uniref:hypothetical protein n=1 Tax=Amphritea sp. HPY TaxID=3421652 RepID=UPI003D7E213C
MERTNNMPLWVFLAFSSITTRKGALILIYICAAFTLYCLPWAQLFPQFSWISSIFLIDDWSWFAMMIPIIAWYVLALRWIDRNIAWKAAPEGEK